MAKKETSAGTLLYRKGLSGWEVLIVHPSGNYNKNAAWSIPKGKLDKDETPEQAAIRETWEETGIRIESKLHPLDKVTYKNGKKVYGFCAKIDEVTLTCDTGEIDQAEFVPLETAKERLHIAQKEFINRLENFLEKKNEQQK